MCYSTRQTEVTESIGLLQGTRDVVSIIKPTEVLSIEVYIDAAFFLHDYSKKLHSGVAIYIAGTLVKAKDYREKFNESELIVLLDNIGLVELFEEFEAFIFHDKLITPTIYQDSTDI
jgi:hypothetical protein